MAIGEKPTYQTSPDVELVEFSGSDLRVVEAARVSVAGWNNGVDNSDATVRGMINHMMRRRHGSVFEHCVFTFRIHTPIFVAREFMRHRTFSFNEESARYRDLEPVFWLPGKERKLGQVGKASEYKLVEGTWGDYQFTVESLKDSYGCAYAAYRAMRTQGIAREVARAVLPVGTYTTFYATCNARALMNFLSLRTEYASAKVPSHPQYEIQQVADRMEKFFELKMPETSSAFDASGRVAP